MRVIFTGLWLILGSLAMANDVILCGPGGTPEYDARFVDWGKRLRQALIDQCGRDPAKIQLFVSDDQVKDAGGEALTMASITAYLASLKATHDPKEPLFIYLIGHGSHLRQEAKFQLKGKDLEAKALAELLEGIPASSQVIINGTSASAGFINVLSGENRVIATATKSSREIQATEFMGLLVQALEEGLADKDGDRRISVYEACWRAASLTQNYYTTQGLIATEHAILDDNGDRLGSRLFQAETRERSSLNENDGLYASRIFIKDFRYPPSVPKSLVASYDATITKILDLKLRKEKLAPNRYRRQLEDLLIEAARLNRRIHEKMPKETQGKQPG